MQTKLCESAFFSSPPGNHKKAIRTKPFCTLHFFFFSVKPGDRSNPHTTDYVWRLPTSPMGQKQFKRSWKEEGAEAEGIVRTTSIDAPSSGRASICLCILEGGLRGAGLAGGPRSSGAQKPQDALRGGSAVCPLCSRNPPLSVRATTNCTAPLNLPEDIHKGWNSAEQVREITGKNKELCGVYLNRESESEVSQLCTDSWRPRGL